MENIKIHCYWDLAFDLFFDRQVELFVDFHTINDRQPDSIKVLFILEPHEIQSKFTTLALEHQDIFDIILTHNEELLKNCKNAHLFEFGGCWVKQPYAFPEKRFEISTVVGGKKQTEGHHLRKKLWYKQEYIKTPKSFFLSGRLPGDVPNFLNSPILGDQKEPLFESQFHITIENVRRKYWFTEKLIDCLQTKTIPIYYGCPNINDYFNTEGMFIVNDFKEIIDVCNNLTEESYKNKQIFIEENFEKSKKFCNIADRLKDKIEKLLKNDKYQNI